MVRIRCLFPAQPQTHSEWAQPCPLGSKPAHLQTQDGTARPGVTGYRGQRQPKGWGRTGCLPPSPTGSTSMHVTGAALGKQHGSSYLWSTPGDPDPQLRPSTKWCLSSSHAWPQVDSRTPLPSNFWSYGKVFKGSSEEGKGTYKSENLLHARHKILLTSPKAHRTVNSWLGNKCSEKLRDWPKSTEPPSRTSKVPLIWIFIPQSYLAVLERQHFSPPESFGPSFSGLKNLTEDGYHTWFFLSTWKWALRISHIVQGSCCPKGSVRTGPRHNQLEHHNDCPCRRCI